MSIIKSPAQSEKSRSSSNSEGTKRTQPRANSELVPLGCGILGVAAAVSVYWMIVPGVIFGAAAVVLGRLTRRNGNREGGSVAIALGIAAIFLVPSGLIIADEAETGSELRIGSNPRSTLLTP